MKKKFDDGKGRRKRKRPEKKRPPTQSEVVSDAIKEQLDWKEENKVSAKEEEIRGGERWEYNDPLIDSLPDRFFNEEGELDLSKVTGVEAANVFNRQMKRFGLAPLPVIRG